MELVVRLDRRAIVGECAEGEALFDALARDGRITASSEAEYHALLARVPPEFRRWLGPVASEGCGEGSGYGDGYGDGCGHGEGYGYGGGYGCGCGCGYGCAHGDGCGCGYGDGCGHGEGYGYGGGGFAETHTNTVKSDYA